MTRDYFLRKLLANVSHYIYIQLCGREFLQHLHHHIFIIKHIHIILKGRNRDRTIHQDFPGCALCLVPCTSSVVQIWCFMQSAWTLRSVQHVQTISIHSSYHQADQFHSQQFSDLYIFKSLNTDMILNEDLYSIHLPFVTDSPLSQFLCYRVLQKWIYTNTQHCTTAKNKKHCPRC